MSDLDQYDEITAALDALADDTDPEQVASVTRQYVNNDMITVGISRAAGGGGGAAIPTGAGSPTGIVTPDTIGQLYIDTDNGGLYIAAALANDEWILVGGVRDPADNITQGYGMRPD